MPFFETLADIKYKSLRYSTSLQASQIRKDMQKYQLVCLKKGLDKIMIVKLENFTSGVKVLELIFNRKN